MLWLRGMALLLGLLWASASALVDAQSNPREALLEKAAAYELDFVSKFSNVVAEEVYVQETDSPRRKRTLRSDFLLVRYPGSEGWLMFRDVFEVDGKLVRDAAQAERMTKLFLDAPRNALTRAREIAMAGSRFYMWDAGTLNHPLLALAFLQPNYQPRFRFNLAGIEKSLGPTIRTVRFQEFRIPAILQTDSKIDLQSRGLMWIDETTGRVVKTRLQIGPLRMPPEIVTTYAFDEALGLNVPIEMRDWFPDGSRGQVRGVATYSRFRRFQVRTEEAIGK
jgi:hypothetical protein